MDDSDSEIIDRFRSELVICKHENKCVTEKLDCLIVLLRRAWRGEKTAIEKISEIISLPSPTIVPTEIHMPESDILSHEYLQITCSLLDDQLKDDVEVKKHTTALRSSSAKSRKSSAQVRSAPNFMQRSGGFTQTQVENEFGNESELMRKLKTCRLSNDGKTKHPKRLSELLTPSPRNNCPIPAFQSNDEFRKRGAVSTISLKGTTSEQTKPARIRDHQRNRPLSAALQRRQDYLRFLNRRKQQRPKSAKPAFEFKEVESPVYETAGPNEDIAWTSRSAISQDNDLRPAISVDISTKITGRNIVTTMRDDFPDERDVESLGDVSEALRRVQEMQTIFRRNTKRLQQKIGIPEAGCV